MPKSNHSMALPSEAAFTARLTAASSVTVMSVRRSGGFRRLRMARKRVGWRLTASGSAAWCGSEAAMAGVLSSECVPGKASARM